MKSFILSIVALAVMIFCAKFLPPEIALQLSTFDKDYSQIVLIIVTIAAISLAALEYTSKYKGEINIEKIVSKVDPKRFDVIIQNTGNRALFDVRVYRKDKENDTSLELPQLSAKSHQVLDKIGPDERVEYVVKYKRNKFLRSFNYSEKINENFRYRKERREPDKKNPFSDLIKNHLSDEKLMNGTFLDFRKILKEIDSIEAYPEVNIFLFDDSDGAKLSVQVGNTFSSHRDFVLQISASEVISKFNLILGDSQQVEVNSDQQLARWLTSKEYIRTRLKSLTCMDILKLSREIKLRKNEALSTRLSIKYLTDMIASIGGDLNYTLARDAYYFFSSSDKYSSARGISFYGDKDFIVQPRSLKVDEEGFVLFDSVDDFNESTLPAEKRITVFSITESNLLSISDGEIVSIKIPVEMQSNFIELVASNLNDENSKKVRSLLKYICRKDSYLNETNSRESLENSSIEKEHIGIYDEIVLRKTVSDNNNELSRSLEIGRTKNSETSMKPESGLDKPSNS